jgi:hypothetical protein
VLGRIDAGRILVLLDRGDYWQCAFVIPKGTLDGIRRRGLPAFRDELARLAPFLRDRVREVRGWDDAKLLTVTVDRLRTWWRPGLLCLGDAAHAMSPIGGVGINLAVQDAVAAANILGPHLLRGELRTEHLRRLQRRREWPTRATQRLQLVLQNRMVRPCAGRLGLAPPAPAPAPAGALSCPAPHPGAPDRPRRAPGACPDARRLRQARWGVKDRFGRKADIGVAPPEHRFRRGGPPRESLPPLQRHQPREAAARAVVDGPLTDGTYFPVSRCA